MSDSGMSLQKIRSRLQHKKQTSTISPVSNLKENLEKSLWCHRGIESLKESVKTLKLHNKTHDREVNYKFKNCSKNTLCHNQTYNKCIRLKHGMNSMIELSNILSSMENNMNDMLV